MKNKIRLIPIVLLSLTCVSATVIGVNEYINNVQQQNAVKNPVLMLDANDPDGEATFSTGDSKISKVVKYGLTWENYKKNMPSPTKPGFDVMGWEYSYDGVGFADVYDSLSFTQNTYLRVKEWGAATKDTFATDSWATIVSYASRGLAALKDAYWADISRYGGTFVIQDYNNEEEVAAKTRTVYLKGMGEYKVHVIGEDEDKIADQENKVAALTFEFDNIVVPAIGFSMGDDNNSWEDSYIRYFLQNSFIHRLPDPINRDTVLQKVVKKTYNQETEMIEDITDNLFIPSLSELGYNYMREDSLVNQQLHQRDGCDNIACKQEGNPYSFYLYENNNDARIKRLDGEALSYWTRSPFTKDIDEPLQVGGTNLYKGVHIINENASVPGMAAYDTYYETPTKLRANHSVNGISPCFCIGQDTAYELKVTIAEGSNIIAKHTNYIANDLDARIQLLDERDYSAPVIHYNTGLLDTETYKEIHVKVNGTTVPTSEMQYTNYTYDRKTGLLNINIDKDNRSITSGVEVIIDKHTPSKFETDNWETFFNNANQGYDNLVSVYNDAYTANGDTFLGLKREVTIKFPKEEGEYQSTILARVIGEKHDETSSGKTALTFQFTQAYKFDITTHMVSIAIHFSSVYHTMPLNPNLSYLEYFVDEHGEMSTGLEVLVDDQDNRLDPSRTIKDYIEGGLFKDPSNIKKVTKSVYEYENKIGRLSEFEAQLFLPSYEELVGPNDLSFEGEGTQYEYYQDTSDFAHRFLSAASPSTDIISIYHASTDNYYCWTRSIDKKTEITKHQSECLAIAIDGLTGKTKSVSPESYYSSIIPCFAVGIA